METAIQTYQQAIARTPSASSEIAPIQNNLGNALRDQFHHTGKLTDLNQAIAAYEQGVQQTPLQSPELPSRQNNLASALKDRFTQTGEDSDLNQAKALFEQAAIQGLQVAPEATVLASRSWGTWATERQAWSEAVTAYRYSLQAIEQLFRNQLLRTSKETWLREVQGISAQAAFALAKVRDFAGAVEALEQGLARLLSEALERDRADLEQLKELGQGELCDRYQAVTEQWQGLIRGRGTSTQQTDPNWAASLQAVRVELEEAIAAIRQVSGYENFLKPPTFNTIKSAAQEVPLIYIVVTDTGGLALILNANDVPVTPLWLPDLTEAELRSQLVGTDAESAVSSYLGAYSNWRQNQHDEHSRQVWFNALDNTTRWLWQVLMGSLVEILGTVETAVLIPVGVLGLLPLHAAWNSSVLEIMRVSLKPKVVYLLLQSIGLEITALLILDHYFWNTNPDLPTGRRYALDYTTFTYAPNARALNAVQVVASQRHPSSLLAISDPKHIGTSPLPRSEQEIQVAIDAFPCHQMLQHEQATAEAVLQALPNHSVLHFSCHGYANLTEPLKSGLAMAKDGFLSLHDLLNLQLTGVRLVILSACETGIPGTQLPDEVVSLPTGLLQASAAGIAASLWSVTDISTMMLLVRFYDLWRKDNLEPATALRQAQLWVRDTSNKQKYDYFKSKLSDPLSSQSQSGITEAFLNEFMLTYVYPSGWKARDFTHPFHWAAFSYVGV